MADIKQENSVQREAFEFYYGLGDQRSLKAVAIQFKRSERTVAGWSRMFSWVDRCTQRALDEAEGREKASMVLDVKTTYSVIFQKTKGVRIDYVIKKINFINFNAFLCFHSRTYSKLCCRLCK